MEYLFIYLLQIGEVFDVLSCLFAIALIITVIITLILFYCEKVDCNDDECKYTKIWGKTSLIVLLITSVLCLFPTRQTILLMGGTYYGKKAIHAVVTDEKLKKIDKIINLELDKRIKDLSEK